MSVLMVSKSGRQHDNDWRSISQRRKSRKTHLEENNLPLRRLGSAEFPKNVAAENQPTTT
jgi:hypothetical protein